MDMTLSAAVLSAIISAFTSFSVTKIMYKNNRKVSLENQLDNILTFAIQYPYLEDRSFILSWDQNRSTKNQKNLRYEIYATFIFNYLSRISKFHNYDTEMIEDDIDIKNWVRDHKEYWLNPPSQFENIDGYGKEFRDLVNKYLG